jgi:microcystin-dependent protein
VRPRYSYEAINALASNDTGHFVFLDAWSISLLGSMLSQERPLYLWTNDQYPLSESEIDDLDDKLSTAQGALMQSLVGLIMPVMTSSAPAGTLVCDGTTYLRADYPNLYAVLDAAFILDADSFVVPDLRDRFVMGTSATATPGTTGGSGETTLTVGQLPAHTHTTQAHTHTEITAGPTLITIGPGAPAPSAVPGAGITGPATVIVDPTGSGDPVSIVPPFVALMYVVVAL